MATNEAQKVTKGGRMVCFAFGLVFAPLRAKSGGSDGTRTRNPQIDSLMR